jgi:DNA-binding LytR/AlgR family response regulator
MITYSILTQNLELSRLVQHLLSDFEESKCLAICDSYNKGLTSILRLQNDIIFIDLDTFPHPFKIAREITFFSIHNVSLIALSKTKKFAYKAMKHYFLDYVMMPITRLEIQKTMLYYKKMFPKPPPRNICLRSHRDFQYVNTQEVIYLKADNNTTDFYLTDGKVISAMNTLKTFEETLPDNFLRVHRSYIINSNYVRRIDFGRSICVAGSNYSKIPFTKSFNRNIESLNSLLKRASVFAVQ